MKQNIKLQQGFTLLELLVVLAILGTLAGLVGPQVMQHLGTSKTKAAKVQIANLSAGMDMYRLDNGRYPTSEQGLQALIEKPGDVEYWNGPYLSKSKVPKDPWNNNYEFASPGKHGKFDIYTLGLDGKEGGEGEDQDVASWE